MKLFTTDNKTYKVKWVEFWNEREEVFLAETTDGNEIVLNKDELNKIEEEDYE